MSFKNFTTIAAAAALTVTLGSCVEGWPEEQSSPVVSSTTEYYAQLVSAIERWWCKYENNNLNEVYDSCNSVVKAILTKKKFQEAEPFLSWDSKLRDRYIWDIRRLDWYVQEIITMLADNDDLDSRSLIEKSWLYREVFNNYDDKNIELLRDYVYSITLFVRLWLVALNDEERKELCKDPKIQLILDWKSTDVQYWINLIEISKKRRNT